MSASGVPPEVTQAADEQERCMPVPWGEADNLRRELAKRGYPSTLCLDSRGRSARLEFWPGVDSQAAVAALRELLPSAEREPSPTGRIAEVPPQGNPISR
jgi:hypothetical protein